MAAGLLLVLADPPPDFDEEFNAWYDTEHLPERARLPGFETALRFTSLGDGPRYAALYDLKSPGALETPDYAACSGPNFSPWSRRVMARAHPLRLTGELIGQGQPTGPLSRLLIMTVEGEQEPAKVADGLAASFDHCPGHLQSRVFKGLEPEPRLIALSMFAGDAPPPLDLAAFGDCARAITLAATYRPYRR
jgi:hypothetical protein